MKIYNETLGQGPDIVLLHGWGLHAAIFEELAAALSARHRVTLIDLPGHGRSPLPDESYTLEMLIHAVAAAAPEHAVWLGWSLGGMISLAYALKFPHRISRLIVVAGSPQYVTSVDWPHAMSPELLGEFAASLENNYQRTLERFLGLQVNGSTRAKHTLQTLKQQVLRLPPPNITALRGGLDILRQVNLRPQIRDINTPSLLIYGERDLLVPSGAGQFLAQQLPHAHLKIMKGAGHAPFISHPDVFMQILNNFLDDHETE